MHEESHRGPPGPWARDAGALELALVVSDAVFELDAEDRVVWVAPNSSRNFGWGPAQLLGRSIAELGVESEVARVRASRVMSDAEVLEAADLRVRCADGAWRWITTRAKQLLDERGVVTGRLVAVRDVDDEVRSRRALEAFEQQDRLLVELAADVVYRVDERGLLTYVSAAATELLGWRPEELIGRLGIELLSADSRAAVLDSRLSAPGAIFPSAEVQVRACDGSHRSMRLDSREIAADERAPAGRLGTLRDIHAEVLAREDLRGSERRLRTILDAQMDAHALLEPIRDTVRRVVDLAFVEANPAALDFFRATRAQVLGATLAQRFPSDASRRFQRRLHAVAETGEPLMLNEFRLPSEGLRDEGYFDLRLVRVGAQLSYTWRDCTERHRAAAALKESEARYRVLVENTRDVVFRSNLDTSIEWISRSVVGLIGLTPERLVGMCLTEFVAVVDRLRLSTAIAQVVLGELVEREVRLVDARGDERWVSITFNPERDAAGEVIGWVGRIRDVGAEVAARAAVSDSERQFRLAMACAPVGIALVDLDRCFREVNPALCELLARDAAWLQARRVADVVDLVDDARDVQQRAGVLSGRTDAAARECRLVRANGSVVWVNHRVGLLRDERGVPIAYVSTFTDVTAARGLRDELRHDTTHDALTHLANRRDLAVHAEKLLARDSTGGEFIGVLYFDVDHLQRINDECGRWVGDVVPVDVARRVTEEVARRDVVARLGGDEFVADLASLSSIEEAEGAAMRIRQAVNRPMSFEDRPLPVSVSIGVAIARRGDDFAGALRHAKVALERAKRGGRATVVTYASEFDDEADGAERCDETRNEAGVRR